MPALLPLGPATGNLTFGVTQGEKTARGPANAGLSGYRIPPGAIS